MTPLIYNDILQKNLYKQGFLRVAIRMPGMMPGVFRLAVPTRLFSLDLSGWEGVSGAAARFALAHGLSPSHSDPYLLFIGTRDAFTGERRTSAEHVRIVFGLLLCLSLPSGRPCTVFPLTPSDILAQRSLRINLVHKISPKTFLRKTFFRNFTPSLTLRSRRAFISPRIKENTV